MNPKKVVAPRKSGPVALSAAVKKPALGNGEAIVLALKELQQIRECIQFLDHSVSEIATEQSEQTKVLKIIAQKMTCEDVT